MSRWTLPYRVEHDFRPYWFVIVEAESEYEARMLVCQQFGFEIEHTDATPTTR